MTTWKEQFPNEQNSVFEFLLRIVHCYFRSDQTLAFMTPEFFKNFPIIEAKTLFQHSDRIRHVGLRSLVLDALWQYRKLGKDNYNAATRAFNGYEGIIEALEKDFSEKKLTHHYEYERLLEHMCHLALSIAYHEGRKYLVEKGESLSSLPYSDGNNSRIIIGFNLLLENSLPKKQVLGIINTINELINNHIDDFLLKQKYYEIALSFAKQIKEQILILDIKTHIAENFVQEAEHCQDNLQKVHIIQQAIEAYRRVPGMEDKWKPLMHKLTEISVAGLATFPFVSISIPLDPNGQLWEYAEKLKKLLQNTSLEEKLLCLAMHLFLPSEDKIIKGLSTVEFEELVTSILPNSKGQTIRIFSGTTPRDRAAFYRELEAQWTRLYCAVLLPITTSIRNEHDITATDFLPYCQYNPFVPEGYELLFSSGFSNWFKGQQIEAASILSPLLENSLRDIISITNPDIPVFKLQSGTCENVTDMQGLIDICRTHNIVEEPVIFNLQMLLIEKSNNIRNNIAHGKYDFDSFQTIKVQILLWIIFWFVMHPYILKTKRNKTLI